MIGRWKQRRTSPDDQRRQRMIDQTSAFLTWALDNSVELPRIPRRRVDDGGYTRFLKVRGGREIVTRWWWRTLEVVEAISERR